MLLTLEAPVGQSLTGRPVTFMGAYIERGRGKTNNKPCACELQPCGPGGHRTKKAKRTAQLMQISCTLEGGFLKVAVQGTQVSHAHTYLNKFMHLSPLEGTAHYGIVHLYTASVGTWVHQPGFVSHKDIMRASSGGAGAQELTY